MKILIITYHRVYNYGSSLQAYATLQAFSKLGLEAEVIDFVPKRYQNYSSVKQIYNESCYYHKNIFSRILSTAIKIPSYKKQKKVFDLFDEFLSLTQRFDEKSLNNDYPVADIYCTGSDQVWNNFIESSFIPEYFFSFLKNKEKCISFASSFGKESFEDNDKQILGQYLKKYSSISVREDSGVKILESISVPSIQLLDPVFILTKEEWLKIAEPNKYNFKYILVYQLHGDSNAIDMAIELSKTTGLEVLRLSNSFHQIGFYKSSFLPTVNEFLTLFNNAEYVITDSFHGTSFSINLNKEFFVKYPQKFSTRIKSILKLTELEDRAVSSYKDISLENKIDYSKVNEIIMRERNRSMDYLREAIDLG